MRSKLLARVLVSSVMRASMQIMQDLHLVPCVLLARRLNLREHRLSLHVSIVLRANLMTGRANQPVAAVLITPLLTMAKRIV